MGLKFATSVEQHLLANIPNMKRTLEFQRKLKSCVAGFRELRKQLEKLKNKSFKLTS